MIKGLIQISKEIRYRIFAIEKKDEVHGELLVDLDYEELGSHIKIFKNGLILVEGPRHHVSLDIMSGSMEFH